MYNFTGFLFNETVPATATVGAYDTEIYILLLIIAVCQIFNVLVQIQKWILFSGDDN